MAYTYAPIAGSTNNVLRSDGAVVPADPANVDYQAYLAWLAADNTLPALPPPTLAQQAAAALAGGLSLACSSNSSLNGKYACDPATQAQINAEITSILLNSTFTNGTTTIWWPDMTGTPHTFPLTQFRAYATAMAAFVSGCLSVINGLSSTVPNASVTIA